jgi:hypothetical protein
MGFYADGVRDCELPECPLYLYMPYADSPKKASKKDLTKGINSKPFNQRVSSLIGGKNRVIREVEGEN